MKVLFLGFFCCILSACASMSTVQVDSYSVSEKFDDIRQSTPQLIVFLNDFPKGADLHNHASGAIYIDESLIFAAENGYFYDLENLRVVAKNNKEKTFIPVKELLKREDDLRDFLNIVSARGWHKNTMNGSDHFFDTFDHM